MGFHDDQTLPPGYSRIEREKMRPWVLLGWIVLLVVVAFLIPGCAADRFLTVEQDRAVHEQCKEAGCRVIPLPLWREIEQYFRRLGPAPAQSTS